MSTENASEPNPPLSDSLCPLEGVFPREVDELAPFHWTSSRFSLLRKATDRYLVASVRHVVRNPRLRVESEGKAWDIDLSPRCEWQNLTVDLSDAGERLDFVVEHDGLTVDDGRDLGLCIRSCYTLDDDAAFVRRRRVEENFRLNAEEFESGAVVLRSRPPYLRVSLEQRCNIPNSGAPCVYCFWDDNKARERGVERFTRERLEGFGDFLELAVEAWDCGTGEPLMNQDFPAFIDMLSTDTRRFGFTTNGQMLGKKMRQNLLGKPLSVYVSIDSPSREGYARYRNDRYELLMTNLRALCEERKTTNGLPRISIGCVVMKSNRYEICDLIDLAHELGVEELKLRALYGVPEDEYLAPVTNNGYYFDYGSELVTEAEYRETLITAKAHADRLGFDLRWSEDWFEGDEAGDEEPTALAGGPEPPLCHQPWRELFTQASGLCACGHSAGPIAFWQDRGDRSEEEFLEAVFNGPKMQEIRRELAAGRLSDHCRASSNCPIVKEQGCVPTAGPEGTLLQIQLPSPSTGPDAA